MKKFKNFLFSVLAMSMVFGMTAFAATESEPNNGKSGATKVPVEEKVTGTLDTANDVDWYSFEITKSGYFYVDFDYDDAKDPCYGWDLTIYDADKEICYFEKIKKGISTYRLPYQPGTYYAKVIANYQSDYYSPTNVEYYLTVHEVEDSSWEKEYNDTRKTANPIPTDSKKINAVWGYTEGDNGDMFSFELSERSMVEITFEYDPRYTDNEISYGVIMQVFKSDEAEARYTKDPIKMDTTAKIALPAGKYQIVIGPRFDGPWSGVRYSVSYKAEKTQVYEECDRVGSKFKTNTDGYMFYEDDKGDVYCYDDTGAAVINQFACDGTYTYFFQADRTAMRDRLTYHPDGVHVIYFDQDGHEVFSNFANVKKSIEGNPVDDYCFFNVFGYLYVDVLTWNKEGNELLYANPYGVLERNGWFQFSQNVIWADGTSCDGIAGQYGYGQASGYLLRDKQTTDWKGTPVYLQGNGVAKY